MYNWQVNGRLSTIFDNLPLCITNGYYPKLSDNLPALKKNIDIDNLCDPQKFKKKPTQQLFLKKR